MYKKKKIDLYIESYGSDDPFLLKFDSYAEVNFTFGTEQTQKKSLVCIRFFILALIQDFVDVYEL